MEEKRLYTTQEVAKELKISDASVRRLRLAGKAISAQQVGRTWLFTKEELERLRTNRKPRGRPKKQ